MAKVKVTSIEVEDTDGELDIWIMTDEGRLKYVIQLRTTGGVIQLIHDCPKLFLRKVLEVAV